MKRVRLDDDYSFQPQFLRVEFYAPVRKTSAGPRVFLNEMGPSVQASLNIARRMDKVSTPLAKYSPVIYIGKFEAAETERIDLPKEENT